MCRDVKWRILQVLWKASILSGKQQYEEHEEKLTTPEIRENKKPMKLENHCSVGERKKVPSRVMVHFIAICRMDFLKRLINEKYMGYN